MSVQPVVDDRGLAALGCFLSAEMPQAAMARGRRTFLQGFRARKRRHIRGRHLQPLEPRLALATWTVTTVADVAGDNELTLREAIRLANASEGPDEILFNLSADQSEPIQPEGGAERVFVFRPNSPLPELSDLTGGTTVDGTSQTQAGGDTNPLGPEIVLAGTALEFATALVLASDANVVRGLNIQQFSSDGIHVQGEGNVVVGNFLGTTADGRQAAGNNSGVVVFGDANRIGGTVADDANVISGNRNDGVVIFGSNNRVLNNRIGTAADDVTPLGNGVDGISISNFAFQNQIGDVLTGGNTIAFNGRNGVTVAVNEEGAAANSIRGNSLHSNVALGIDLTDSTASPDGVTVNDSRSLDGIIIYDEDDGANRLQNFPEISNVFAGQQLRIEAVLLSRASQSFTVDFYVSDALDASGFGEGQQHLGSTTVQTDAAGRAMIELETSASLPQTAVVTATATDSEGNTSEFSAGAHATIARSISGLKYRDLSGDGFSDDDVPLAGVTIELHRLLNDPDGENTSELVASFTTANDGTYRFDDLRPAVYRVIEVIDDAYTQTAGGNEGNPFYTIDMGVESELLTSTGNDFANFQRVPVQGITWEDLMGDGLDETDLRRGGVAVQLFVDNGDGILDAALDELIETALSNESGEFEFPALSPGVYFAVHLPGENAVQTFGGDSIPDIPYFTLEIGSTEPPETLSFGSFLLTQLAGQVTLDPTGDGPSADDAALEGVTVQVYQDQGDGIRDEQDPLLASVNTGQDGRFAFDSIGPGRYFMTQIVADGFEQIAGGEPPLDFYTIENRSGQHRDDLDFAVAQLPTVSGTIWDDANPDGTMDIGEPGLADWTVVIADQAGGRVEAVTDEFGRYSTTVRPGRHRVEQVLPPGWESTFPLGRFETRQAISGGVIAGFALVADVVGDGQAPGDITGSPDLIMGHDVDSPSTNQGSLRIVPGGREGGLAGDPSEVTRIELGVHTRPKSAIAADLDGDGDLDLAVATAGRRRTGGDPAGSLVLLRNDSDGLVQHQVIPVSDAPAGWNADGPVDLVAVDLNGDGRMDLATVDFRSNTISIFNGIGGARFRLSRVLPSVELAPRAIAAVDLDRDGQQELIVAYKQSNVVAVFRDSVAGDYQLAYRRNVLGPADVAAEDLDHDGLPEIVVAGSAGVSLFWNEAGVPHDEPLLLVPGMSAQSVAFGDVNDDGAVDAMVALPNASAVGELLNLGQRQFAQPIVFPVIGSNTLAGVVPQTVAVSDLDGDDDLDVAVGLAVGGACVLSNAQGNYDVEATYGQKVEQLDFGNVFAGIATVPGQDGERREVTDPHERLAPSMLNTPSAASVDLVLGAADELTLDVSGDGLITPLDALLIVNRLNQPTIGSDLPFDVNRDGSLSPLDALLVINQLNESRESEAGLLKTWG
jgi:protocatechuate 3,4-dioxygenase beta subunit